MAVLTARTRRSGRFPAPRRRGELGFSLPELLVAILILAFVILGVLSAFGHGIQLNSSSRDYTAVSNLAKSQLEELIALPFGAAALTPGVTHSLSSPDSRFTITYTVVECAITTQRRDPTEALANPVAAGMGNVKRITLTVTPVNNTAPGLREVTVEAVKHVR